jgi:alpha-galactosidase
MKLKLSILALFLGFSPIHIYAQDSGPDDFHKWALTPPMGWNSWDCFGPSVVEEEVKANAAYMANNLKEYGWEYVVVDIRWYVDNQTTGHYNAYSDSEFILDEYGRYLPSPTRFPSSIDGQGFKPLADYVHGLGLKFGIHIMRGVPKEAVNNKLPIKGTSFTADQIYSTALECTWLKDNWTIVKNREGAQEYYNSILDLYASWGVDYIKVDDLSRPYHADEIEMLRAAIDQTGRPIVLSMSPGATPLDQYEHAKNHANLWRTIDDFWDNWSQLNYSFGKCAEWAPHISPGSWPDADMLPMGHLAIRGERGEDRYTNFTKDEQYTLMTLWTIFKSPLMFGGHMPDNDDFTNSLLTNEEVLFMHKTSVNNLEWLNENNTIGWVADDPYTADKYVALFNNAGDGFVNTDRVLYRSGTISKLTDGYGTQIDITIPVGSTELYLIVNDGGDNFNCDHADWIEPTIYYSDGSSTRLTELSWVSATAGWGSVQKNKSVSGGPLIIDGTTYENGIGTHSKSIIKYAIPNTTNRFTAFAGLDQAGLDQECGSTVEFLISVEDPTPNENNVETMDVRLNLSDLGIDTSCEIRDMWDKSNLGIYSEDEFVSTINAHGATLLRLSQIGRSQEVAIDLSPSKTKLEETDSLTFSVQVYPTGSTSNIPTGWIQIYQGDELILNTEYEIGLEHTISPLPGGDYIFKASYSGNTIYATTESDEVSISVKKKEETLTGIDDSSSISIYPNPVDQYLFVDLDDDIGYVQLSIWDISGAKVSSIHDVFSDKIDVGFLKPGLYILRIEGKNVSHRIRILKN